MCLPQITSSPLNKDYKNGNILRLMANSTINILPFPISFPVVVATGSFDDILYNPTGNEV